MNLLSSMLNFFKRTMNMELYVVTIDTTFAKKLGNSLQNYGFCYASDHNAARERFLSPLRQRVPPTVLAEIFPYVYAYKLSDITSTLSESNPLWSYVPSTQQRQHGQQVKTPFVSQAFQEQAPQHVEPTSAPVVTPPPVVEQPVAKVEEFAPPEGITDPVQIALLKTLHDMKNEIKQLKTAQAAAPAAGGKVSVQDLESRFRAPPVVGDKPLDPNAVVPVPDIPNVVVLPKGKIDTVTLARLRQNIVKTRLEDMDDVGPNSGIN